MAVGDIPKIPREYYPRLQQLADKLKSNDISTATVEENALSLLGRARITAEGVRIAGDFGAFELDREGLSAIIESMKKALDLWPLINGREFLVKQGGTVTRWRLGRIPRKSKATQADIDNSSLPVFEYQESSPSTASLKKTGPGLPLWLKLLMDNLDSGHGSGTPTPPFKIRRIEELMGWIEDWEQLSQIIYVGIPSLPLTQKKRLDKLGESLPAFIDALLTKCGV